MATVSVIGLGNMGLALAQAFNRDGHMVTVWNRSPGKGIGLSANVTKSAADAFEASEVSVICVASNENIREILTDKARSAVRGKTVVNLTTGTPSEAEELAQVFAEIGADYLDGTIPAYPNQIGEPGVGIILAGSPDVWRKHQTLLKALGGATWHMGEAVGAPSAIDIAMAISFYHASLGAFIEAASYAMKEGVSAENLKRVLPEILAVLGQQIPETLDKIVANSFDTDQATVDVHLSGVRLGMGVMKNFSSGRTLYMAPLLSDLERTSVAGLGGKSMAAISTVLGGK
jgi:3-hydroxyisobutyrate dehydrogenase-like beta-hydroxyacid dehydrogenase